MVEYGVEDRMSREKPKPVYFWLPGLFSGVLIFSLVLGRLLTKNPESFLSWNLVLLWCIVGVLVFCGISLGVYLIFSLKHGVDSERKFLSREACDRVIRQEMMMQEHYNLETFTRSGESIRYVGWLPDGIRENADRDKFFGQLYRAYIGGNWRYVFVVMNMEEGHQDDIDHRVSTMNFLDLHGLFKELGSSMCRNGVPKSYRSTVEKNVVTGVSVEKKSLDPLDSPENEDYEENGVKG